MEGTIKYNFIKYVSLNILAAMGASAYILVDTYFVANGIGATGLSSLNLAIALFSFIQASGLMLGIGGATKFAIEKAKGKEDGGNSAFTLAVKMAVLIGAVFVLGGLFFSRPLGYLIGANGETIEMTSTYLKTIMIFAPFFIINHIMVAFIRNDGDPKLATIAVLMGNLFNVIFDYIFIYPFGWGIFGAAFATGVSPVVSLAILSLHFFKKKNTFHLVKGKTQSLLASVTRICSMGGFAFVNEIAIGLVVLVFNLLCLGLGGNMAVAAYGVVANLGLIAVATFSGVAQGIQPLISACYGRGQKAEMKQIYKWAIGLVVVMAAVFLAIALLFSTEIADQFNREHLAPLTLMASEGLKIYFAGLFFAGVNIVTAGYLAAKENAMEGFVISLARGMVVIIPVAMILSKLAGLTGVWMSFGVAEGITLILSLVIVRRGEKNA